MKKLLDKLELVGELTVLSLEQSKSTFGGCLCYDNCGSGFDGSTSYDTSQYDDPSTNND